MTLKRPMWTDGGDAFAGPDLDGLPPVARRHICHGGGGGQQGGQSFSTTSSTTTSAPHPLLQPILTKSLGKLEGFFDENPNAPALFPGSFTATPSMATVSGNQSYRDLGTHGLGYGIDDASRKNAYDVLSGKYLDPSKNEALQKYLRFGFDEQNDAFNTSVLPNLRSQFAGSGRTGNPADYAVAMDAAGKLAKAQAGAAAGAEADAYHKAADQVMRMQSMLPSFQGMDMNRAAMLARSGGGIDAHEQKLRDEAIFRDTYGKTGNLDYWTNIAGRALGMFPGGQTQGTGTSQGYSSASGGGGGFGSIAGPIMSGVGMALPLFFSDRRDKTDIEELGVDPLTGLKTYAYRYKSDPKTYPKVVGPMAQDMEERDGTWHVREIGGRKVVAAPAALHRRDPLTGLALAA
jgi:hypothetical protein